MPCSVRQSLRRKPGKPAFILQLVRGPRGCGYNRPGFILHCQDLQTLEVDEEVPPPLPVQSVWKNFPLGLSNRS